MTWVSRMAEWIQKGAITKEDVPNVLYCTVRFFFITYFSVKKKEKKTILSKTRLPFNTLLASTDV